MIQECLHRRVLSLGLLAFLLAPAGWAGAELPDNLPPAPDYLGEIRRTPDGKLTAQPIEQEHAGPVERGESGKLLVGPGERIGTVTEAARLARDGDIVEIRPGNYRGQTAIWTQNNLVIRGSGGRPVMLADGQSAEGKAIWVVRGGKIRVENIEFRGARVPSLNGAGIRFEKGDLTIRNCTFLDNEMGILAGNSAEQTLAVIDSEFGDAPRNESDPHHLIYVGAIGKFVLSGSRFRNGYYGHLVKSRARENHILYNMLVDGARGQASYELEFPNGGLAYVIGNAIGQSAGTGNPSIVSYGAEGRRWPDNALYMSHNTLINDYHAGRFLDVHVDRIGSDVEIWLLNNLLVGVGDSYQPARGRTDGNHRVARAELIESGGIPLRLTSLSPLRGAVRPPGQVRGVELLPNAEFRFPVGSRNISPKSALAPGAFQ